MVVFVRRSLIRGRSRSGGPPRSACFAVVARRAAPIVLVLLVSLVAALALAALALVLVVLARASPMAARAVASRVAARAARAVGAACVAPQTVPRHRLRVCLRAALVVVVRASLMALALVLVVLARASPMAAPRVCVPRRSLCSALVALRDELVTACAAHVVFSIVPASAVR